MNELTGICLLTDDVPRLAAFYADLLDGEAAGDDVFAEVPARGAQLTFFSRAGMERLAPGARGAFTVEIRVDDVDQTWERLRGRGVAVVKPPTTHPWGRRSVWFRDPDGGIANCYRELSEPERVVRTYFHRLFTDRDLDVCEELLARDYVDHDAPADSPPGPAATRAYVERMLREHPELTFQIEDLVANADTVALRAVWRAPELDQRGLVFLKVNEGGQIAERWSAYV